MTYNLPETVYYKTAKQLQRQGPLIRQLSKGELGFDISAEEPVTEQSTEHREDAARSAADKLVRRGVSGQMGYLKNRPDGSASLAIITPDPDSASSSGSGRVEKPASPSSPQTPTR